MTDITEREAGRSKEALAKKTLTAARASAEDALDHARERVRNVGKAAEANPLAVVAGGIALGVVAGALLPRTRRETELLGTVGKRMRDVATGAADAAKGAATAELASLPLSRGAAREQVGKLIDQVSRALSSAGAAALTHTEQAGTAKPAKTRSPRTPKAK